MAFVPEDQTSSIRVEALPQSDSLLEFSSEEDRTPVDADRRYESQSGASRAWRAFISEVALNATRCLTWLSTCQADLKVRLYEIAVGLDKMPVGLHRMAVGLKKMPVALERMAVGLKKMPVGLDRMGVGLKKMSEGLDRMAVGLNKIAVALYVTSVDLYEMAGALGVALRVRSHVISRRSRLGLSFTRATFSALVMRASAFTSRRTFYNRRALIPFGCGVAAGVIVKLFLPVQAIPAATMSTPAAALSQPASQARNVTATTLVIRPGSSVPSAKVLADVRSARTGVKQMTGTAGRREPNQPNQTSAVPASQLPSPRNASVQRAASAKLAGYRGSLAVSSAPTGARVLVNGVPVGTTPLLLKDVPVGSRVVRLELDGYEKWSSAVRVVANQRVRTAADLQRSPSND